MDDPGHGAPRGRPEREHGPAAPLGDEIVLQMLPERGVAGERAKPFREPGAALAQLPAEPAQGRRRAVAEVGAVVLDCLRDRVGDHGELRVDPVPEPGERGQVVGAVQHDAGAEPGNHRRRDGVQRPRVEDASASGELGRGADVQHAGEIGLLGALEQHDGLGGQDVAANDLGGIRVRDERACPHTARLAGRDGREPFQDLGQLQELEGSWIHRGSVGRPAGPIDRVSPARDGGRIPPARAGSESAPARRCGSRTCA